MSHPIIGIILVIFSMLFFSITYTFYKVCLPFLPNTAVLFFQSLFSFVFILPFALKDGFKPLITSKLFLIITRTLLGAAATFCIAKALVTTNLSVVVLLNNTAPLFVPFVLWIWLKKKVPSSLWYSLVIGFIGVFFILNPTFSSVSSGLFFALASGLLVAITLVVLKKIAHEPFIRVMFYYFLVCCLVFAPSLFMEWNAPPERIWIYLILSGATSLLAQLLFIGSVRFATSQEVAPFVYMTVVFSILIDWLILHNVPTLTSFIGMGIVCLGGVLTILLSSKGSKMDAIVLVSPVYDHLKKAAKDMGYKVISIFPLPLESYYKGLHLAKEFLYSLSDKVIISSDKEDIILNLKTTNFIIKGAIASYEEGVELADQVAHALSLPHNPVEFSLARRDKAEMRKILKKTSLSCPGFTVCTTKEQVINFANTHKYPLIIKTPKGSGSSQVYECDTIQNLLEKFDGILGTIDVHGNKAPYAVVEEYIGGKEYTVNTFSDGTKVHVTDVWYYDKINTASFKNIYYNIISLPLYDPSYTHLKDYAIKVVETFKIDKGPSHIEIKDDPTKGPTLIEIGARFAGLGIPDILKNYTHFDPYKACIEVFTEGKTIVPAHLVFSKRCAFAFCPFDKEGVVKEILGLKEITALKSYVSHTLKTSIKRHITPSTDLRSIPFTAFLANKDSEQLFKDIQAVHDLFQITLD